jgi:hypothetical protein
MVGSHPMSRSHSIDQTTKSRGPIPHNATALDTLAGVQGEMARVYRLALNGKVPSDEMTRFIYALKEIRACGAICVRPCAGSLSSRKTHQ